MPVPASLRTPFTSVAFDPTKASQGPAVLEYVGLILSQKRSTGTAAANSLTLVSSEEQAIELAGRGSLGHLQVRAWRDNNTNIPLYLGLVEDNGSGVAATGTITVSVTTVLAGIIALYMGGIPVLVQVNDGDTDAEIATAIAAAITANPDLPVTASATLAVVTWTFRHAGEAGNSFDVRDSFNGESLPSGVSLAYVHNDNGAGNPTLTTMLTNLGEQWFHIVNHPWTDATSLAAIETEMASRADPMRSIDGMAVTGSDGSLSALSTLGNARNSAYSSIWSQPTHTPLTPSWEFGAEVAAVLAGELSVDPARPITTVQLARTVAAPLDQVFTREERNTLLHDGIATTMNAGGGKVAIERGVTTYQTNAVGAADTAYLDITTVMTLLYLRYEFRTRIQTKYSRHKLADDSVLGFLQPGQYVMTPSIGKAAAIEWFTDMRALGLVEDLAQFKKDLVVERNSGDPNRLDWVLPPDLINKLVDNRATIQPRL